MSCWPFYDFSAEHWIHLRATNPIESTFSTVKLLTKVIRGAGSPAAALAMVFKLVESAQTRWRAVTAPHLVASVLAGARFENGRLNERPEEPVAAGTPQPAYNSWGLLSPGDGYAAERRARGRRIAGPVPSAISTLRL